MSNTHLPTARVAALNTAAGNASTVSHAVSVEAYLEESSAETVEELVSERIDDAKKLRLAMAIVDGISSAADDRAANTTFLRNRLARAVGQDAPPQNAAELRSRLKSLARVSAFERLRVGRALSDQPMLSSLFALGHVSFSQRREVTRYATAGTDAEFAIAVLELSVSETIEYCRRFRHVSDKEEDAANTDAADQEQADSRAALRAYQRRTLSIREIDTHSTRIMLELPNDLAAEFLRSLEQVSARQLVYAQDSIHGFESFTTSEGGMPLERAQLRGQGPISHAAVRRIAASAGYTVIATDDHGDVIATRNRAAPFSKSQLRTLVARDLCCQVPGCGATRNLHGHHFVHRENGGRSDLTNAALVCSSCHRLLHEGGSRLERIGPNGAAPGPYASALGDRGNRKASAGARVKINTIRRFRLYGPTGCEHESLGASREAEGHRTMLVPKSRKVFTRGGSPAQKPMEEFIRGNPNPKRPRDGSNRPFACGEP